jgi:hypothetical protein
MRRNVNLGRDSMLFHVLSWREVRSVMLINKGKMKKDEKKMKKVLRSPCNLSLCAYRQRDNQQKYEIHKQTNQKLHPKPLS